MKRTQLKHVQGGYFRIRENARKVCPEACGESLFRNDVLSMP